MEAKHRRIALLLVRWAARITGVLVAGLVLAIVVGESITNGPPPLRVILSPIHLGMMLGMAGMMIGWWREGLGAVLVLGAATGMYAYELIAWQHWLAGAFPLFWIPGSLLLVARLLSPQQRTT